MLATVLTFRVRISGKVNAIRFARSIGIGTWNTEFSDGEETGILFHVDDFDADMLTQALDNDEDVIEWEEV